MEGQYSRRSPAVKRLMKEAQELSDPTEQCYAQPLEDNLFEWHFTVRGPPDSDFQGGVYHGRITLPPDYPMKPPSIMLLTPTGRFEVGTKICLSISGHHPETWQPSWSIRTVMLAIIGFMPTKGEGAIGSLDYTPEERKLLAKKSQDWTCPSCKKANKCILPKETSSEKSKEMQREAAKLASQISFKKEEDKKPSENATSNPSAAAPQAQANTAPPAINPAPPPNPFAAFNPAALGMHFQPSMFPGYPPNFMNMNQQLLANQNAANPAAATQGTNQTPPNASQSPAGQSQSSQAATSQSPSTDPQATGTTTIQPGGTTTPELRQRVTAAAAAPGGDQTTQPRTGPQRNQTLNEDNSGGRWALVMMVVITIIMLFLLGRRLFITYEYKFQSGGL
ncbi:ubiquitin-conjugating enzyme E2 J1-like [Acanthaster planci]|uniref:Ubiquitin-conjugating enzyme E2 J1 n=1 Tax=Acanthaster planci TaxID=133434 RepID=A0A8B7XPS9_ACAPL|nr:ubiquitin-conjugating enzyme E2 J1-like [Acanthaster planci]